MKVLLTGGAGYIGSHTALELAKNNFEVYIIDNLANSSIEAIFRVEKLTGKKLTFFELDLLEREALNDIFDQNQFDRLLCLFHHWAEHRLLSMFLHLLH